MQIRFANVLPWWLVLAVAIAGFVFVVLWYWRESKPLGLSRGGFLAILRGIAFLLFIVMLLRPSVEYSWIEGELSRLRIIVDTSRSMQTLDEPAIDSPNTLISRIDRTKQGLVATSTGRDCLLNRLAREHRVELLDLEGRIIWDSEMTNATTIDMELTADGASSPIGEVLMSQFREKISPVQQTNGPNNLGKGPDAIVFISDGQSNGEINPTDILDQNASVNIPIYTIAAGQSREPIDLGILTLNVSNKVRREDLLKGTIRIKEECPNGTSYQVRIKNGGVVVYEERLVSINQGVRDFNFEFPAREAFDLASTRVDRNEETHRAIPIDLECELIASEDLSELTLTNNVRVTSTWGVTRENKILLLDPRGRWETRYIRNALERDPNWELIEKLGIDEFESSSLLDSKESLLTFDLVIITHEAAITFSAEQSEWISDFISQAGGGLIWIGSARSEGELSTVWNTILPFRLGEESVVLHSTNMNGSESSIRLSAGAVNESALQIAAADTNSSIWEKLLPPRSAILHRPKPGSEILVEFRATNGTHTSQQLEADWYPLMTTSRFGQGRVIALASDESWRWRYGVADLYHQRFWNQVSSWCMRFPFVVSDDYLSIDAGSRVYGPDDLVVIRAKLLDTNRLPIENGSVRAVLSQSGVPLTQVEMVEKADSGGIYQGVYRDLEVLLASKSFDSSKEITVHIEASGIPWEVLKSKTSFRVDTEMDIESTKLACDTERLQSISSKTEGEFLNLDSIDKIEDLLSVHKRGVINRERFYLTESYIWLAAIMVVLALEWTLRKRFGLV